MEFLSTYLLFKHTYTSFSLCNLVPTHYRFSWLSQLPPQYIVVTWLTLTVDGTLLPPQQTVAPGKREAWSSSGMTVLWCPSPGLVRWIAICHSVDPGRWVLAPVFTTVLSSSIGHVLSLWHFISLFCMVSRVVCLLYSAWSLNWWQREKTKNITHTQTYIMIRNIIF